MNNNLISMLAAVLTIIGAINWGLVGLLNYNLVEAFLGAYPIIVKAIYIIIGAAGIIHAVTYIISDHKHLG